MHCTELLPAPSTSFKETEKSASQSVRRILIPLTSRQLKPHPSFLMPASFSPSINQVSLTQVWIYERGSTKTPISITHRIPVASINYTFSAKEAKMNNVCCRVCQHDSSDVEMDLHKKQSAGWLAEIIQHLLFFPCDAASSLVLDNKKRERTRIYRASAIAISKI